MTIIVYTCDTCARDIERVQNKHGLDVMGKCIITDGCPGMLHKKEVLLTKNSPAIPTPVVGVTDWKQRKALFNHEQTVKADEWTIHHEMGSVPYVIVYTYNAQGDLIKNATSTTTIIDENTLKLSFTEAQTGIAQCIARSSVVSQTINEEQTVSEYLQITANGIISVGVRYSTPLPVVLDVTYTSSAGEVVTDSVLLTDDNESISPWNDVDLIAIQGGTFKVIDGQLPSSMDGVVTLSFQDVTLNTTAKILLAKYPYEYTDRNYNEYITINAIPDIEDRFKAINSELTYTQEPVTVYPSIKVLR